MSNEKKMEMLAEIMELDVSEIREDAELSDYDEWDSITALSVIALVDEQFHKNLSGNQVKEFRTIKDVLDVMEE
ncbi:acyl carrier protein [Schaedlerella arabinosiphila]|jgi:acyl carrier protein|uniref:Acyl carrier protein n=1 Tax=Schaedlerella arabinosiphila TaxID=2044587 RepID=A0A3R8JSM5_9FIRM|nr:acyl carrier protein [Schaedlerella arabinosiphila]RRK34684.1 acyl carrier protein [Schaedlerella arabinosiphila]